MSIKGTILTHSSKQGENKVIVTTDKPSDPKPITPNGAITHQTEPLKNNNVKKAILGYISHEETIDMVKSTENLNDETTVYKNKEAPLVIHNKNQKKPKSVNPIIETENNPPEKLKINVNEVKKNMAFLQRKFNNDVGLILDDILNKRTNFESYSLHLKIKGFIIIYGEEGISEETEQHCFALRTLNPNAISYMISIFLTVTHKIGYNSIRILDMLKDTLRQSPSLNDWLMLLSQLWIELKNQKKI